jgi:[pyruvate, water dikinase]-phosphate phosphotransferase / [pyruvate, water dikinase] kinase
MACTTSEADLILVGVSRSGKTPTCLYMALHYGVGRQLSADRRRPRRRSLPPGCARTASKLFGLTIDPERLQQIREERRPGSRYATAGNLPPRSAAAEQMLQRAERIPMLSTTHTSIEEIASKVLEELGINREMF